MTFIEQCKGKMFDKLPRSKKPHESSIFYASIKLDGHYTQIHIDHVTKEVKFFTSGAKEFYLAKIADELLSATRPLGLPYVVVEAEYVYACKGLLGDRVNSARLTTYRTAFEKGQNKHIGSAFDVFNIFNIINLDIPFESVVSYMEKIEHKQSVKICAQRQLTYEEAHLYTKNVVHMGWEGVMLNDPYQVYKPGKRLNTIIKIKYRPELVALVINELEGEGRLEGAIGALECSIPGSNKMFKVGSGLDDYMRSLWTAFEGQLIEVEYEQLSADGIPLQPTFKRIYGEQ